ncbi:MAG: DUF2723 domain-containing protein [bacterium]|nr:DUF2723 domain-containing protein [bacterium]
MKKKDLILSVVLFGLVLGVYLFTITPTLPFWDCGEFISCSYSLGVPHPPGTPLMILLGNMFVKLFFFIEEVALRVNLFSAIASALAAVMLFLIILKVFARANPNPDRSDEAVNYAVAFLSAFLASFLYSFWQSAVEAEVYNPALLMILTVIYLSLIWWDKLEESNDDKFVMLIIYIAVLSIGIHMLPLLALPGALLFFIIIAWNKYYDLSVSLIAFSIFFAFMYLAMTKEVLGLLILGVFLSVISVVVIDSMNKDRKLNYVKVFSYLGVYILLILVSISTYAVLIIRAKHNPYINIAAPVTMKELWDVFNRKQYGPMNILPRKTDYGIGTLSALLEQFKMYFRYYSWQFSPFFRAEVYEPTQLLKIVSSIFMALVSATGLYGIYMHFKREKKTFVLIFIIFLLLSAGLVTYLNLKYSPSDINPKHIEREVRERDYFYAPSYFLFMFFFAFGIRELIASFKKKKNEGFILSGAQTISLILLAVIAVSPIFANINSNVNRRDNWIADEYAKNMLDTPKDNAVVFTNGDNDTYPLWFEQVVKNYRVLDRKNKKGVMVCNLSLLNTPWYIKQMRSYGVPIGLTDAEIDNLVPVRLENNEVLYIRDLIIRSIICSSAGIKCDRRYLYATTEDFKNLVLKNYRGDSINVYFSVTVSEDARAPYRKNALLEGLAYRIVGSDEASKYPNMIDVETTKRNILEVYKYDYILNEKIKKDDNIDRIMTNYAAGFLQLGLHYAQLESLDLSVDYLRQGRRFYVYDRSSVTMQIARFLLDMGRHEEAEAELQKALTDEKDEEKKIMLKALTAEISLERKDYAKAMGFYFEIKQRFPKEGMGYSGLLKIYRETSDKAGYDSIVSLLKTDPEKLGATIGFMYMQKNDPMTLLDLLNSWLSLRPGDIQVEEIKREVFTWDSYLEALKKK